MDKIYAWLTKKFEHPLSPLFFFFGALLILLAMSNKFDVPFLKNFAIDPGFRSTAIFIGVACFVLSIILYYRPPKHSPVTNLASLPPEYKDSMDKRFGELSDNQSSLLHFLQQQTDAHKGILQSRVEREFSYLSKSEVFYRLEHLRLLGFLENQKLEGGAGTLYKVRKSYKGNFSRRPDYGREKLKSVT
ncbi:MAG TPA: hypothetical protein VF131_01755 [Blastocatellia bacterium]|nr:hypothetical protein [Blastocatellia bacterium]